MLVPKPPTSTRFRIPSTPGAPLERADRAANGDASSVATRTRQPAAPALQAGTLLGLLALALLGAPEARAQCVQMGTHVTCTGTDPDGFAAGEDSLEVSVEPGATVENGGTGPAIQVQQSSQVTVAEGASLTATGTGAIGAAGVSGNTITNQGDVIVTGTSAVGVALGSGGSFSNESTGRVLAAPAIDGGAVTGVRIGGGSRANNDGLVRASGDGSTGFLLADQSQLQNSGTISAPGTGGIGVSLGSDALLTNLAGGLIEGGSGGAAVRGANGDEVVVNSGSLVGDVQLGFGNDLFNWGTGSSVNGSLDGGGHSLNRGDTLRLFQSDASAPVDDVFDLGSATSFEVLLVGFPGQTGTWTLTGSGDYPTGIRVQAGTAQIADGTTIQDPFDVQAGQARLGDGTAFTSGVVVSGGRAVFEDGASVQADIDATAGVVTAEGTSSLQGDVSLGAGASYQATLDAATSSRLDVQGAVDIAQGASLQLTRTDFAPRTQSYRVLSTSDGITGALTPGAAFQRVTQSYGPASGASFLDVTVESSFTLPATSPNQRSVGQHLDLAGSNGPSPAFQDLLAALDALPDAAAGRGALDALQPEVYDSATSASFETARSYAGLLAERPLRCESFVSPGRRDRPSLEPCGERGLTPWVAGFGRYARRDGTSGHVDWSYGGGGLAFGADQSLRDDLLLSGMVGTSRTALDYDGDGDASLTTFDAGVGLAWRRHETHVRGVVEYGHGWSQSRRSIDVPGFSRLARASYGSDRVTALVEAGHAFVWRPFEVEPIVTAEYTWLREDSFRESDAGVAGLRVDSRDNALFATNAGVRAGMTLVKWYYAGPWLEWADGVWRPQIDASWRQVWNDYDRAFSSRLRGAPPGTPSFRTTSQDAEYGADLGARVSFQPQGTRNTVELGYEAFVGNGTMVHSLTMRFRMPF